MKSALPSSPPVGSNRATFTRATFARPSSEEDAHADPKALELLGSAGRGSRRGFDRDPREGFRHQPNSE